MKRGFITNIEKDTVDNKYYREVLYTAPHSQLVLMSIEPGDEIGEEVHDDSDQFFRFESGNGIIEINGQKHEVSDGSAAVVPVGTLHNVINVSDTEPLQLYAIYSPPHHKDGTLHATKEDEVEEHFDGELSEIYFPDDMAYSEYASQHKMRPSTKVKIGDKTFTAGTLDKKLKSAKKSKNPYIAKYGKLRLNAYPEDVNPKTVKVDTSGDINTHAVMTWKDPKSGRTVKSYTQAFMKANAKIKWNRVKKMSENDLSRTETRASKLLKNRNAEVRDGAAIISIISQTGLRPGSMNGYEDTGNRGISTLGPDNVRVEGDKVILNFVGKSYKPNNAEFTDPQLADYMRKKLEEKKGQDFLFDTTQGKLNGLYKKIGKKNTSLKDLRTFRATKMAKDILESKKIDLPEKPSQVKKVIKEHLKEVFEQVSQKLNNTPAMAKNSYVHPQVITDWLKGMGVEPKLVESMIKEEKIDISEINKEDLESCDVYPLPNWWDNDKYELIPIKNVGENKMNEAKKVYDVTLKNYKNLTNNKNVTRYIKRLLDKGEKLVVSDTSVGEYVTDSSMGMVQRIKETELKEQTQSPLQKAYAEFFRSKMEEFGVKSPVELKTTEERKKFWNSIKNEWPEAKKKIKEGYFRQTIRKLISEVLIEETSSQEMKNYLSSHNIPVTSAKYNKTGSMKGTWHLYGKNSPWTRELIKKLNDLDFRDMDGKLLNRYSGNGGQFDVYVRFDDSKIKE